MSQQLVVYCRQLFDLGLQIHDVLLQSPGFINERFLKVAGRVVGSAGNGVDVRVVDVPVVDVLVHRRDHEEDVVFVLLVLLDHLVDVRRHELVVCQNRFVRLVRLLFGVARFFGLGGLCRVRCFGGLCLFALEASGTVSFYLKKHFFGFF